MSNRLLVAAKFAVGSACLVLPASAFAAEAGDNASAEADGQTIVVTAQKIEQRAIDVPITISAM